MNSLISLIDPYSVCTSVFRNDSTTCRVKASSASNSEARKADDIPGPTIRRRSIGCMRICQYKGWIGDL